MMNTTSRYPSKRPSVKQVSEWDLIYSDYNDRHWRGDSYNGRIEIYNGYPFPDFYKVVFVPDTGKKTSKLFYGEVAHFDVVRYAGDLGFHRVSEEIL
jgi:hypothetical protein